jgi:hypothetical protein
MGVIKKGLWRNPVALSAFQQVFSLQGKPKGAKFYFRAAPIAINPGIKL